MTFTSAEWTTIAPIIDAIEGHPFVLALEDGSLARPTFEYYMAQDATYLHGYSRMLALAAAQAQRPDEVQFWASSAQTASAVERSLHEGYLGPEAVQAAASPTCTAYTSWMAAQAASGSYASLVASVLPCFWIYEHVGTRLLERAGDLGDHPYADWISTYADPSFAESSATARTIVDRACDAAEGEQLAAARHAFETSARYEWMFWDAAWRLERWPV